MKMTELQFRIQRVMEDLDAIALEMYSRGFEFDWYRIEGAKNRVGDVAIGFLDEETLDTLDVDDCYRPEPGLAKSWNPRTDPVVGLQQVPRSKKSKPDTRPSVQ